MKNSINIVLMELIKENAMQNMQTTSDVDHMEINQAKIQVIGIGGAGNNMVGWLYNKGIQGAEIKQRLTE